MKHILCYGDSNTWGYIPGKATRWPDNIRWPGVMAKELGKEYRVLEDAVSGRTTIYEDPNLAKRCGLDNLGYSLIANAPIDLLIIALGSNDLKFTDAEGYRKGMLQLLYAIENAERLYDIKGSLFAEEERILLLGPPIIDPEIMTKRPQHMLAHAAVESKKLASVCKEIAEEKKLWYLNISELVLPSSVDCLHLSEKSHNILGCAVAEKVRKIFTDQ